jgi:hypothetical protein
MSSSNVTIEKLDGNNFHNWKLKMKMILIREDLWEIVNGESECPASNSGKEKEGEPTVKAWTKNDQKALATIFLAITNSQLTHIKDCMTSKEAWDKLQNTYEVKGLARKLYL